MISMLHPNREVFYLRIKCKFTLYWTFQVRPLNLGHNLKLVQTERSILIDKMTEPYNYALYCTYLNTPSELRLNLILVNMGRWKSYYRNQQTWEPTQKLYFA